MKKFLLDLFFPKYCVGCKKLGVYICADCFASIEFVSRFTCAVCNKGSIDGRVHPNCRKTYAIDGVLSAVVYKGIVKKILYQFKYRPYLSDLEWSMGELFYEALIQNEMWHNLLKLKPILFPVPLHPSKYRTRGYNHAELLAKNLSAKFNLLTTSKTLLRIRNTKPQFSLKKEERIANIKGAFAVNQKFKNSLNGENIFLIDDLATSFITLTECASVLKKEGARQVWGITFAREE